MYSRFLDLDNTQIVKLVYVKNNLGYLKEPSYVPSQFETYFRVCVCNNCEIQGFDCCVEGSAKLIWPLTPPPQQHPTINPSIIRAEILQSTPSID